MESIVSAKSGGLNKTCLCSFKQTYAWRQSLPLGSTIMFAYLLITKNSFFISKTVLAM